MNFNQIMKNYGHYAWNKRLTFTICLLFAVLSTTSLHAQTGTIEVTGRVTDVLGDPMPGVSIIEKGTTNGIATDNAGHYRITVSNSSSVLVFSFIGFNTTEQTVGTRRTINVKLDENLTVLDDVVVIGYGTTTKKEVTGSVSSLSSDNFKSGNVTNPLQLLQGQIAGLVITRPDGGNPNGDFEIQLRGLTTMSGGAQPLIVIDGVVGGDLSSISADNIQSFDVLKDGSAAAIYGTRGTNGVILVTTKKAAAGVNKLEFNSYLAIQTVDRKPGMMNADEFRQALAEYGVSSSNDHGASTDWFDEVTRTPISQNYSLASSGGTKNLNYRASISWNKDEGLVKKSTNERLRTRLNVVQMLAKDRLKMDYTLSYSTAKSSYADNYIMRQAMFHNPTEPISADQSTPVQYGPYYYVQGMEYYNPVAMLEQRDDEGLRKQFTGSVNANLRIFDSLKANVLASMTTTSERYGHYYGKYHPVYIGKNGQAEVYNNHSDYKMLEATIDYSKNWNDHKLQAIAGYSYSEQWNEEYGSTNYLFDTDYFSFYNIGAGGALKDGLATMSSSKQSSKLISFFGRVMYNYKEKYLLSASVRYEGSSRFGANHKWGTFPSVSVGWRITQEQFMEEVKWLEDLKLRAGFGVTGNQEIGNYQSLPILRKGSSNFYYNNSWLSTYEPGRNPNPDLRWEKKNEFNVGFDASFLNNKLNVSFDYYNRTTKDLLYTYNVPVPPNLYGYKFANVGTIVNKGLELTISAVPYENRNFRWNVVGTLGHNTNKLKSFSNADYAMTALDTGYLPDDLKVYTMQIVEGGSIGNFWGPKFIGFDNSGVAQYEDIDGVDGITEADYQKIGNAYPDITFSLQNSFVYKNFDLSFLLRGMTGNDVLNKTRLYYDGPSYLGLKNVLNSTFDNENHPGAVYSSYFIEDGSFLKLDNVTLGYTLPMKSDYISKLRVYVTGQNLFTITGYKGIDPEVSLSGLAPGIENYDFYPRTKTFIVGLNLVF